MMKKDTLIQFIDKYYLGNSIKSVSWKVVEEDKTLRSRGELDSKSFIADVILYGFEEITEEARIPIIDTQRVKSMLAPFGEEISLILKKENNRILGFSIYDKDCESYCAAADISAIPPVTKDLEKKCIFDLEIPLNEDFIEKFLKAKMALNDTEEFIIRMNNDKVEFVLGYSNINSNRISLIAPTIQGKDKFEGGPGKFPLKNLVEVFKANKEMKDGILNFNKNENIIKIFYKNDQFQCSYWQFNVKK